jgi:iron complex outermembrane receptor protein
MKKVTGILIIALFCGGYVAAQTEREELAPVEIVGYRLSNIPYTDSIITIGGWNSLRLLDIPYSISTLTSDMMKNLQVGSLNEVSKYMPSMQIEARGGLEVGRPQTRGFQGSVVECSRLDGMNIVSTTAYPMEQFDRFEVLNGIAGSLYGPASPAGSFNYASKRVGELPVNDASISYQTLGIGTYHADVGRRFLIDGDATKSFGFRANALYADGEGFTEYSNLNRTFLSGAFDARYGNLVIETHLGRYHYKQYGYPGGFSYAKNVELPDDLDPAKIGYGQEWAGMDLRTVTANATVKYTVGRWQITAGVLSQTVDRGMLNPGISVTAGDSISYTLNAASAAGRFKVLSNRIAVNGLFNTGKIAHNLTFGTSGFIWSIYNSRTSKNIPLGKAGIYAPRTFPMPTGQIPPVDGHYKGSKNTQQSLNIGDDIAFGKHFSAMLSMSYNIIDNESYSQTTGEVTSGYSDNGFCYAGSLLYKPVDNMTVYATYSDVVQQGQIAPKGAANEDELLDPYRCRQYELGYKASFGATGAGVALFDISRPFPFLDSEDNVYKLQGIQENMGIEVYGDAVFKRLHALGGITFLNPKLKETGIKETSGKDVVGVPGIQANLFVEYQVLGGMSLNGNIHHTGSKAANDINTLTVAQYTTFDLGLRYSLSFMRTRIIWNLQATNLFNTRYWASIFPGSINGNGNSYSAFLGSPREIKASMRILF